MTPESLAAEVSSLFTLPELALRACAVMDAPAATAHDLIEVIELDANLAARVLRLANSALYGQRGRVDTLSQAIALIGHKAVRDLVLATSAARAFHDIPAEFVDMDTFWDNSTTCAVFARLTAHYLRMRDAETLFLAGLLHSVGRLVFYARRPAEYREVLRLTQDEGLDLNAGERKVFGFDHSALGAALLQGWQLPERLHTAVRCQLDPTAAPADYARDVAVVHLAAAQASNIAPCLKTRQEPTQFIPDSAALRSMQWLELTPAALQEIRLETLAASLEVIEIINPGTSIIY
ncbi:MAG: HDOD domain-containing protein [Pseudomonadota bacterium]